MKGHGAKLPRKQEAAIAALLQSRSVEEAAQVVQVSANTLRRWMELTEFRTAYLQARRIAVMQASARMQQNAAAAASVLLKLMADSTTPPASRVRAAVCVLERAYGL